MFNTAKLSIIKMGFNRKLLLVCLLLVGFNKIIVAASKQPYQKISFDKNPVLNSDSLKTVEPKAFVKSSLNQLSENIYFSALNSYFFLFEVLKTQYNLENSKFNEILGLKEFYSGNKNLSIQLLTAVFNTTNDSAQKAKICLNLIKINYLNSQLAETIHYVKIARDSLNRFYSTNQKYELLFTEAKIALTQGLTSKAENLIITRALPMSNRVKGKLNEFNCYLFLGKIYLKARQLTQAKWFFIQANTIAVNQHYVNGEIETSLLLAKTKIKVGDSAVALQDLARAKRLIGNKHSIYRSDLEELTRLANR